MAPLIFLVNLHGNGYSCLLTQIGATIPMY